MYRTDHSGSHVAAVHSNYRHQRPTYHHRDFPVKQWRCRPPEPPDESPRTRPANFVIKLLTESSNCGGDLRRAKVNDLIKQYCKNPSPDGYYVSTTGSVAARVCYTEWNGALEAVVALWKARVWAVHEYTPTLIPNVVVPSDIVELDSRLRPVLSEKIESLRNGEPVKKWKSRVDDFQREVDKVSAVLRRRNSVLEFERLRRKKEGILSEKEIVVKKIREFECAMECIFSHIHGGQQEYGDSVSPFRFKGEVDWARVYDMILRECRRLDDGLPIYASRREILNLVDSQQIMILIGETGSGKSTQLVQFLADSDVVASGAVICTQPRKIAATSLEHRVQEESHGCYNDSYISCLPYYSSTWQPKGGLIYMTDHCLLQHCMNDGNLKGVSCIIVDEAHERSLNTDLLLAVLKRLLPYRPDLRLIIMSATADADQLSKYFFGCQMFFVGGRKFPVEFEYVPSIEGTSQSVADIVAPYVYSVMKMVTNIHKTEQEGTILAFLTSAMEVEWASENFQEPNAVPLALHGKLSYEEQSRVFQNYHGKRKIIFTTNIAETSLTIPGVKFVVDSGMMKEIRFEPGSGMNVLKVCRVSKSSANQRAGRAGRTESGRCYRLYSYDDYLAMPAQQEPEIRRVHLGVAILKVIAMGVKNVKEFDFVDSPSSDAIDMAIRNLVQLRAVASENGDLELTDDGRRIVKMGTEPRLGKMILSCFDKGLGKEGLVLAALMAHSNNIFCRVGNQSDRGKSDCLKVPFCHADGDLFTLLSVYKAWESERPDRRNGWCWENSINAKSMRRCHDIVSELENCLKTELRIVVPSYWNWTPEIPTIHHRYLKMAVLASLSENIAMFSGCNGLGYNVALTGQHVQLHPSCSLLMFNQKPDWVVFGEILNTSCQYLVCVSAFDRDLLCKLTPPPLFDPCVIEKQKLILTKLPGLSKAVLKSFCGKLNNNLLCLVSKIRRVCGDDRIRIEVDVSDNVILIFSCASDVETVLKHVEGALGYEGRWLSNECMERCLYQGSPGVPSPIALFGSGAEIKHLELFKRCLTVDVFHPNVSAVDDKELLLFIESHASGICSTFKSGSHNSDAEDSEKWGSITFLTPDSASKAAELNNSEFDGFKLRVSLSSATFGRNRGFSFPILKAKLIWPRRQSKGYGILKCDIRDVEFLVKHLSGLLIGTRNIQCDAGRRSPDSVLVSGIDRLASESEVLHAIRSATDRRILDFFLIRGDAIDDPPCHACEEVLFRELSAFMPKGSAQINFCRVSVFPPDPKHTLTKAIVNFDGRLHFEAAKALEQIEGTILPGFQPWQKIECERSFRTAVSCPSSVYAVIKREIDSVIIKYNRLKGTRCTINKNTNGSVWVRISAPATKTVAELRRLLEELMKGRTISHPSLTSDVLQLLYSRDGNALMRSFEREMEISLSFDKQRQNVRIFSPSEKALEAEEKFIQLLLNLYEDKQQEVHLRGVGLPSDLMKQVVRRFGHDLHVLKDMIPNAHFTLNTRRHVISISGSKEAKQKVEEMVNEISQESGKCPETNNGTNMCPICFCEVDDEFQLSSCMHVFCRSCLVEQCESAIRNKDSFPICCYHEGCRVPIWLIDLRSLLSNKQQDELFEASMVAFVSSSCGKYRYCPSPDCPAVYMVSDPDKPAEPFLCGACYAETCTKCHFENHPDWSCEQYKEFKEDPDASLKQWWKGKDDFVKKCPGCGYTIEKAEGCNHVECKCGRHLCWVCLRHFITSDDCYDHLRNIHQGIT